jgi:pimeloyl-ACP methyl ester carboxylesterase
MKKTYQVFLLFILTLHTLFAQTSALSISETYGPYNIGFREYNTLDKSRSFALDTIQIDRTISRPIQICVWYPATPSQKAPIEYKEYFFLKAHETGRVNLTETKKSVLLDNFLKTDPVDPKVLQRELNASMKGVKDAPYDQTKKFPVLIYGPSWWSSAFENALLFEFLASHGYVIISSPSVGPYTREMPISRIGVEAQARDMEFLLSEASKVKNANVDQITVSGFSLGGLSNVLMMARNPSVDAWIGFDPSIHEAYDFFKDSPYENYNTFSKPMLFINSLGYMNDLPFYDKLVYSDAYMVNLPKLGHTDMASQFIKLFGSNDKKENLAKRTKGYNIISKYTLDFLDGVFKTPLVYDQMISQVFNQEKLDTTFIKFKSKKALPMVDNLFKRFENLKGHGLLTFLNKRGLSENTVIYLESDLQKLIFLSVQNGFKDTSKDLMEWYQENYTDTFHEAVLKHMDIWQMLIMFTKIYENNTNCEFSYYQLNHTAQLMSMGDKKEEAIEYFSLNTKLNPKSFQAYFNLGIGYFRLNDFKKAAQSFKKCLELKPDEKYKALAIDFLSKC